MTKKLTYDFVKKTIEEIGWKLVSKEYKNANTYLNCTCDNGHELKIRWSKFNEGIRCKTCSVLKQRHTIEFVRQVVEEQGCTLISTEYISNSDPLEYECAFGHKRTNNFWDIRKNKGCKGCGGMSKRHKLSYVQEYFKKGGCILLAKEYTDSRTAMSYICSCGDHSTICFDSFKRGSRCKFCGIERAAESSDSWKEYIFPSGKRVMVQGYEDLCLNDLLEVYEEDDIVLRRRDVPEIYYEMDGNTHRYYVDIYIKSVNLMIEVKSPWTYSDHFLEQVIYKADAASLLYPYEIWIYTPIGQEFEREILVWND